MRVPSDRQVAGRGVCSTVSCGKDAGGFWSTNWGLTPCAAGKLDVEASVTFPVWVSMRLSFSPCFRTKLPLEGCGEGNGVHARKEEMSRPAEGESKPPETHLVCGEKT